MSEEGENYKMISGSAFYSAQTVSLSCSLFVGMGRGAGLILAAMLPHHWAFLEDTPHHHVLSKSLLAFVYFSQLLSAPYPSKHLPESTQFGHSGSFLFLRRVGTPVLSMFWQWKAEVWKPVKTQVIRVRQAMRVSMSSVPTCHVAF